MQDECGDKRFVCQSEPEKYGIKFVHKAVAARDNVLVRKELENFFQEINVDELQAMQSSMPQINPDQSSQSLFQIVKGTN